MDPEPDPEPLSSSSHSVAPLAAPSRGLLCPSPFPRTTLGPVPGPSAAWVRLVVGFAVGPISRALFGGIRPFLLLTAPLCCVCVTSACCAAGVLCPSREDAGHGPCRPWPEAVPLRNHVPGTLSQGRPSNCWPQEPGLGLETGFSLVSQCRGRRPWGWAWRWLVPGWRLKTRGTQEPGLLRLPLSRPVWSELLPPGPPAHQP